MTLLNILGTLSLIFVVVFTYKAYYAQHTVGQSPRSSIIEAWGNLIIGFSINYLANYYFLPLVGAHFTAMENFMLGWCYTLISVIRQYAVRRWFNRRVHEVALKLSGELK